jgi:transposase
VAKATGSAIQSAALKWYDETKLTIFGMVERSREFQPGRVVAKVLPDHKLSHIKPHSVRHVEVDTTIMTDDGKFYRVLRKEGWDHHVVKHNQKVYVDGDVHTQQIDGFWSLVKRGISGTHFHVSQKWLLGVPQRVRMALPA